MNLLEPAQPVARLRHGNPSGNPQAAPRCGAHTRRGLPCRAPAIHGKRRCRLHGGLSTGPTTVAGLARLRAAHTTHGRFSIEGRAFERHRQEYLALVAEVRAYMFGSVRSRLRRQLALVAQRNEIPAEKLEQIRQWARAEVADRDAARLRAKGLL